MEVIFIALKDIYQSFKSWFMIAFAFGIPLLLGGFLFFVFGDASDSRDSFALPETSIAIVNLDEGHEYLDSPMGNLFLDTFTSDEMPGEITVVTLDSVDEIQPGLLADEFDVGIVIPENFTADLLDTETTADVDIFAIEDENTTGVGIVKSMVQNLVTGLESSFAATTITYEEAMKTGLTPPPEASTEEYEASASELVTVVMENVLPAEEAESITQIYMKPSLGGMMIFFSFFTGCSVAATILEEEKINTLQRMFTAPFSRQKVISGKFLSTWMVIFLQVTLLLLISRVLFGLRWGPIWLQVLFAALTATIASTFGIFLLSFLKEPKTAGMIYSGINTITGMIAIASTFSARQDVLPFSLFMPHAWPLRMIYQMQRGFSNEMLVTIGVILLWSAVFFAVGLWMFNRRYMKEA